MRPPNATRTKWRVNWPTNRKHPHLRSSRSVRNTTGRLFLVGLIRWTSICRNRRDRISKNTHSCFLGLDSRRKDHSGLLHTFTICRAARRCPGTPCQEIAKVSDGANHAHRTARSECNVSRPRARRNASSWMPCIEFSGTARNSHPRVP